MARSVILLKPNVDNILLFNFCKQKFVQHGPIMIAIDCNGLSLLIFEEKYPNYASGRKIRTKQWLVLGALAFQCMRAGFQCPKMRQCCLITYPPRSKWASYEKTIFFAKISIFCKSIAGPVPGVVQAYTQSYSFDGRIKLIVCQIRHELSVTIHEISTTGKKTLDGGPYSNNTS